VFWSSEYTCRGKQMTILIYEEIVELRDEGYLPKHIHIGPSSADLRLGNNFSYINQAHIILGKHVDYYRTVLSYEEVYVLRPNEFVLGTTKESINLPNSISAYVEGRSSVGRLGLQVQNASFIDAGFRGEITLELHNQSGKVISLVPGVRVCQIVFFKHTKATEHPYRGKYDNQRGATGSKLEEDYATV